MKVNINLAADKARKHAWDMFDIWKKYKEYDPEIAESLRTHIESAFLYGYSEAKQDLALTWEDMKAVIAAEGSIYDEHHGNSQEVFEAYPTEEAFYGEVLRRFNEKRKEK